ncbi:MAG: thiamine-phosphate kinase [Gammaproteobacteria bacterium]|nr:thiamine-phosphate kinase [Gammaproteobacteria bacterium]
MPGEFELIRKWFADPAASTADASLQLGIGDDGAVFAPTPGCSQIVVTDTLVAGRHFPDDAGPAAIGHRALAVNLSDMAAMGARPKYAFLNLTLPESDEAWLGEFSRGFFELAREHHVALAGGDTTRGPLNIAVTLLGEVPEGSALTRSGACVGDLVAVTGRPGRAATALVLWREGKAIPEELNKAWLWPTPRVEAGIALRGLATACIDVSDGLVADFAHIAAASDVGARLDADALPRDGIDTDALFRGDDYELCFTFAPADADRIEAALTGAGQEYTVFGEVVAAGEAVSVQLDGEQRAAAELGGWDHFQDGS